MGVWFAINADASFGGGASAGGARLMEVRLEATVTASYESGF